VLALRLRRGKPGIDFIAWPNGLRCKSTMASAGLILYHVKVSESPYSLDLNSSRVLASLSRPERRSSNPR
jgi:hypothetical protein